MRVSDAVGRHHDAVPIVPERHQGRVVADAFLVASVMAAMVARLLAIIQSVFFDGRVTVDRPRHVVQVFVQSDGRRVEHRQSGGSGQY